MVNLFFRLLESLSRRIVTIIWKLRLRNMGNNTIIDLGVNIFNPQNIDIGKNCVINKGVILQSCKNGKIKVGDNTIISYNSILITCGIDLENYPDEKVHFSKDITIENDVWIGANVTILPGVTIEESAIIAANSVVTNSVLKNSIVAGVPAKEIKKLK